MVTQKIDDMKMIIEDLEALKELADELEENHVETEKQMQEEIGKPSLDKSGYFAYDSFLDVWATRLQGSPIARPQKAQRIVGRICRRLRKYNFTIPGTSPKLTNVSQYSYFIRL
jgi:hypothetical protein